MKNLISMGIIIALSIFDLLEPIFRKKELYFSIKIDQRKIQLENIYKDYLKKIILITLPIGIFLWSYYPMEENFYSFLCGFLIMVFLNLFFYFTARREIKTIYNKRD